MNPLYCLHLDQCNRITIPLPLFYLLLIWVARPHRFTSHEPRPLILAFPRRGRMNHSKAEAFGSSLFFAFF